MPEPFAIDLDTVLNRKYPVIDHIDPAKTAMLVVDMQRYFLDPDQPAYLPGGDGAPSSETVLLNVERASVSAAASGSRSSGHAGASAAMAGTSVGGPLNGRRGTPGRRKDRAGRTRPSRSRRR